jgi:signal transduction histidine kinase
MLDNNDYFKSSLEDKAYFLTEVAAATKTGVYSANFTSNRFYIDVIGKSILNFPPDYTPSINEATYLFCSNKDAMDLITVSLKGLRFERDLLMSTYDDREIWMRFTGKPRFDADGDLVGVRGVFTSIDKYVRERQEVENHNKVIEAQSERLLHFTHIVSHNLRSHSSNLELTLELFKDILYDDRSKVFYSYLNEVSNSLSSTLNHLNQVLTINSEKNSTKILSIDKVVRKALLKHDREIERAETVIKTDFIRLEYLEYVPSFLENIVETLIENAIQYRDPSRPLVIQIRTKVKNH